MKLFISWSGDRAGQMAAHFHEWFGHFFPDLEPWKSEDIPKGQGWMEAIERKLEGADLGLACLTKENLHSDWLQYEVGYLRGRGVTVATFLLDLRPSDLKDQPLSRTQHTVFARGDFLKLVRDFNDKLRAHGQAFHAPDVLEDLFQVRWPELKKSLLNVSAVRGAYTERDLLTELVARVSQIQRSIFGRYNDRDTVLLRGSEDYMAPRVASLEEMVELVRDPQGYQPPRRLGFENTPVTSQSRGES